MEISLKPNKILRTGDQIIDKVTNQKGTIHYLVENGGQTTFEREVSFLESVQFDNGSEIVVLPIERINLI